MYAYADQVSQQEKLVSGAFAFAMHLIFLALLVFGINWQKKAEPQINIVDLWAAPSQPQPQPQPKPEPVAKPPPQVKPQVTPKVEPPPPVKAAAKPEVAKPDIALKQKAEKERRLLEEKQKEAKKREEEARAAQKLLQEKEDEAQRLAREQEEARRKLAEQAAAARQSLISKYTDAIKDKIGRFIVLPPNLQGNPEAEFDVVLLPDGNLLGVKLKRTSGNSAYDNAVERAILKAQPLPLPPDPALFRDFRELNLKFRPQQ